MGEKEEKARQSADRMWFGAFVLCLLIAPLPDRKMLASVQFLWYGSSHFGRAGYAAIESPRALDKIDLSGKTILVTGGNAGLGYAACSRLGAMNADVILVARNEERGSKAV